MVSITNIYSPDSPYTPPYTPPETPPTVNIEEEEPPLAMLPDEEVPLAILPEEEVPLALLPATGDASALWMILSALSGTGLVGVSILGRKKRDEE